MNPRGKKLEPKLGLDMSFGELVQRLVQTHPKEIERSMTKAKRKKPPGSNRCPPWRAQFQRVAVWPVLRCLRTRKP